MIIYDDDGIGYKVVPMSVIEDIKAEMGKPITIQMDDMPYREAIETAIRMTREKCIDIIDRHIGKRSE